MKECCNANSFAVRRAKAHSYQFIRGSVRRRVVNEHAEYLRIRKEIDDKRGIITPIRALVFDSKSKEQDQFLREIIDTMLEMGIKYDYDNYDCRFIKYDLKNAAFMNKSKIVGYLVALPDATDPDRPYVIGESYCRPHDFEGFDREAGIVIAYKNAEKFNSCYEEGRSVISAKEKLITTDNHNRFFYVWPFSYDAQWSDFAMRCGRYFKVNKEESK